MRRKGSPSTLLVGCKLAQPPLQTPQQIKNRTTYNTASPLTGIYLKETETLTGKDIGTLTFTFFTTAKKWK